MKRHSIHRFTLIAIVLSLLGGSPGRQDPAPGDGQSFKEARSGIRISLQDDRPVDVARAGHEDPGEQISSFKSDNKTYDVWHLEFDGPESCAKLAADGVFVFNRFKNWADVYALRAAGVSDRLAVVPGLVWMDRGRQRVAPPPKPGKEVASRATPDPIVRGGLGGLTGKGVIIAVVDSGLDFRHPDFTTTDAGGKIVSRVLHLWDTTSSDFDARGLGGKAPISYPNGASVGTVYSKDQLTAELRASKAKIGDTDANGHGTSCAGIATGNGRAYGDKRYCGVAPEADIIGVRVGGSSGRGLENTYLIGAICAWIDSVAGGKPCVVSCSFGGQYGGRDGAQVVERQLDARFAPEVRGRSLCIAAGNDGEEALHAEARLGSSTSRGRLEWEVPAGIEAYVSIYFSGGQLKDLRWKSVGKGMLNSLQLTGGQHGLTKQAYVEVSSGGGSFAIELYTASGETWTSDAYISGARGEERARFVGAGAVPGKQIGTPATCRQAITVGSYDFNDQLEMGGKLYTYGNPARGVQPLTIGAVSGYSNPGPLRIGDVVKPDIVAPGQFHTACRPTQMWANKEGFVETSGKYCYADGTSSATPYVAGLIALMLQKEPSLTVEEIRSRLRKAASKDAYTGDVPNPKWGHGKLDLKAARALVGR